MYVKIKKYFTGKDNDHLPNINYTSLYDKLGGPHRIDRISKLFYSKLVNDTRINHYFVNTNVNLLISKQILFLTYVFGGSQKWNGKSMSKAHKHMKITDEEFDIVKNHFHDTLSEFSNIQQGDIESAIHILESTRSSIVKKNNKLQK